MRKKPTLIKTGQYYTVPEVEAIYGWPRNTITKWLRRDWLVGIPTGIGWLVEATQLDDFEPPGSGKWQRR